ncbi:TPA: RNA polymerase sigma factor [Candidatus Latescibacteria bacterium]|nr:RNA polymerase sigma factor [Candidatus Latescibacterota bacterium]
MTNEALIMKFLNGDTAAFNTLVNHWQKRIHNFVLRYADCPDTAKNLTQQTFIRVYQRIRKLDNPTRFSSWLYRIALNAPTTGQPDEFAHRQGLRAVLGRALQEVPEQRRVIVIIKEYQELKFREIAEVLELPNNTVKSRLYYGLKALRNRFDQWNVTEEVVWYDV